MPQFRVFCERQCQPGELRSIEALGPRQLQIARLGSPARTPVTLRAPGPLDPPSDFGEAGGEPPDNVETVDHMGGSSEMGPRSRRGRGVSRRVTTISTPRHQARPWM